MDHVELGDLKKDLDHYFQMVKNDETIVVTDQHKKIVELRPLSLSNKSPRPFALCKGEFTVPDDFDDPLPEGIIEEFEGR
ncbi:MAG: type II toxin-antitoxin system Phd/YefM family antitoxin [Planctomycetota bacterium]|nr:type II toxin-antitoxin system Phd/YefM family antitoxin [Planctomycetota bacterium]